MTGDIGIRSISTVLRKNKSNEYRLSPVYDEEPENVPLTLDVFKPIVDDGKNQITVQLMRIRITMSQFENVPVK